MTFFRQWTDSYHVVLFGVCGHPLHPVALSVFGEPVGKFLGGACLRAVEDDDVLALKQKKPHRRSKVRVQVLFDAAEEETIVFPADDHIRNGEGAEWPHGTATKHH